MSATKTPAESQDKAPSAPSVVSKQPETPEKASGPQHAPPTTTSSPPLPPNDATSVMRDAEMVTDPKAAGASSRARTMMTLQRRVGNNRVSNLVASVQTKLTVGAVDDPHEREADRVAEAIPQQAGIKPPSPVLRQFVMKHSLTPPASAQRQITKEEKQKPESDDETKAAHVQRKEVGEADHDHADADMERRIASPSGGQPLPEGLRGEMEAGLGADFSQVRVHDNSEDQSDAQRLSAKAFTHGEHIWLGAGESAGDRKLMAHELAHVVQQGGGGEVRRQPLDGEQTDTPIAEEAEVATPETEPETKTEPEAEREPKLETEAEPVATTSANEMPATTGPAQTPPAPVADAQTSPATEPTLQTNVASTQPETNLLPAEIGPPDSAAAPNLPPDQPPEPGNMPAATVADEVATPEMDLSDAATPEAAASETPGIETPAMEMSTDTGSSFAGESSPAEPQTAASASGGLIQRQESDNDDGILAGIRRRIRSVVDGLRSGWDSLSSMAVSAFDTIRTQVGDLINGLRNVITTALSAVQNAWTSLVTRVQQLADGVKRMVQAGVSAVVGAVQAIGAAIIRLDPLGLSNAWARVTSIVSGINQRVQQALQVVFNAIAGLWQSLRARFDAIFDRLTTGASALRDRALAMVQGLRERVASAWQRLRDRAQQMSGVLGGVLERLRSLLSSLLEWGQQIWGRIQQGFSALASRLAGFIQQVLQRVMSAWQALRQRASALWARLQPLWNRIKQSVSQFLQRLANGIRTIWGRLVALGVGAVISFIQGLRDLYRGIVQLYEDVRGFFEPIATKITDMVYAAMPQKALEFAQTQITQVLGVTALTTPQQAPEQTEETAVETKVQRVPRDTATFSEIGTGFLSAIIAIWRGLSRRAVFDMVLDALLEQLFPPLAVYRQLRDFIFQDLAAVGRGLFMPRNIFTDPLGALHDIYTNLYHLVVGVVLSFVRRLINILMAFQLWITIILTVIGAVGGSVAVGILGGILAGLATVGLGAGAGAAGGAAAGGAAGAGVGFGVALLIGEAVFFAFLATHWATIVATLVDLKTTRQSTEEKERDYAQLAESAIAVGVGLALLLLAWIAGWVAKGVAALIEGLGIKVRIPLPPSVSRFLRGIETTRPPEPGGPGTAEQAARLAAEQRLSQLVGGDLARLLVNDLGPVLAEEVVARLGPGLVRRLAADLTPEAIARIAQNLATDAVERLLDGGMRPQRIHTTVVAGHANRLAALTAEQITKLSALSDEAFARIIGLSDNSFARFVALDAPQLRFFAGLEEAQFNRFAALDDATFTRFGTLTPQQLEAFARMSNDAFNRYTSLTDANFAKFASFSPDTLVKFGNLSDTAFNRYAALNGPDLAKFNNVTQPSLERLATRMPPGELEAIATLSEPDIHRHVLGYDPAPQRFRASEADTALRLEQKRGIVLDRFDPIGTQKGDWVDLGSGQVYDGCSPPESRFFDPQISSGNYERSLTDHVGHPDLDFVVVDTTGLGLTPAQEAQLQIVIDRVAGPANPKIVRIP